MPILHLAQRSWEANKVQGARTPRVPHVLLLLLLSSSSPRSIAVVLIGGGEMQMEQVSLRNNGVCKGEEGWVGR